MADNIRLMLTQTPLIEGFVKWLHSLSGLATHRVSQFVSRDARMRTPDAEAEGTAAIAAIYKGLFDDTASVVIRVNDRAAGADGHTVYLRWDRLITGNDGRKQVLSGITELMIGTDEKITSIIEHWDRVPEPMVKRSFWAQLFNR